MLPYHFWRLKSDINSTSHYLLTLVTNLFSRKLIKEIPVPNRGKGFKRLFFSRQIPIKYIKQVIFPFFFVDLIVHFDLIGLKVYFFPIHIGNVLVFWSLWLDLSLESVFKDIFQTGAHILGTLLKFQFLNSIFNVFVNLFLKNWSCIEVIR